MEIIGNRQKIYVVTIDNLHWQYFRGTKSNMMGYWFLQTFSRILHNWYFLEIFVQIPKNNSK